MSNINGLHQRCGNFAPLKTKEDFERCSYWECRWLAKITLAEMRSSGIDSLLVCCSDYFRCLHWIEMSVDQWPEPLRLSNIEPRFVCTAWAEARCRR
jgi:hypothetical protein